MEIDYKNRVEVVKNGVKNIGIKKEVENEGFYYEKEK